MSYTPDNLDNIEQSRASKVRFKQQIFASIGGGMIFALVGVITAKLLAPIGATHIAAGTAATATTAAATGSMLLPILGIAAVAAIGISCVYLAAKYLSKAVSLDQETQAEKISQAAKGRGPAIAQEVTLQPAKPYNTPMDVAQNDNASKEIPGTKVTDLAYQQKMAASHGEKITLH